jgi:hypothetical protein
LGHPQKRTLSNINLHEMGVFENGVYSRNIPKPAILIGKMIKRGILGCPIDKTMQNL